MFIRSVFSQTLVSHLARLAAAIGSRVIGWGRLTPFPPASGGWRNTPATARLRTPELIILQGVVSGYCSAT